jgi:ferredoxin
MDRLTLLDAGLRAFDTRLPEVVPWLCVATRYRASSCRRCVEACPADAVSPSPWLAVDADRCTSCGACAAVCRTGALTFSRRNAALRELVAAAVGETGAVTLACSRAERARAGREAVAVECAGGLSCAELLATDACGATDVTIVTGHCEGCPDAVAGGVLDYALLAARATLALHSARALLTLVRTHSDQSHGVAPPRLDAGAPVFSRRDLFSFAGLRARRVVTEARVPAKPDVETLHRQAPPPAAHAELVAGLQELASTSGQWGTVLPVELPLARLSASADCDLCGLCERYCPHRALAVREGRLQADPVKCTACGLCAEVCPRAALALDPVTPALLRGGPYLLSA